MHVSSKRKTNRKTILEQKKMEIVHGSSNFKVVGTREGRKVERKEEYQEIRQILAVSTMDFGLQPAIVRKASVVNGEEQSNGRRQRDITDILGQRSIFCNARLLGSGPFVPGLFHCLLGSTELFGSPSPKPLLQSNRQRNDQLSSRRLSSGSA